MSEQEKSREQLLEELARMRERLALNEARDERLSQAQKRLRLLDSAVAASGSGILITDPTQPENPIVYANRGFERITGYEVGEVIGLNCRFLQGSDRDQPSLKELRAALAEGRACKVVLRNYCKDGTLFYNGLSVSPVHDEQGNLTNFVGVIEDITERKFANEALRKSEERFRAFVEATSDVVYRMSADWHEMRSLLGQEFLADTEDSRRDWSDEYIPEDEKPRVWAAIEEAIRTESNFELEHRVIRVDATTGWTSSRAVPILDEGGEIVEWLGTASDITERKRSEEALLEIREAERRRIARDLHDAALQDLSGALQTVQAVQVERARKERGKDNRLEQALEAMQRAVRGLRGAIYDLRQKEKQPFVREVESLVEYNRQTSPERELTLKVEDGVPEELPEAVSLQLLRIVQEALTNVRRHSGARRASVTLGAGESGVWVRVSDNGRGFEPHATPEGMGLSELRERVLTLGGTCEVRSELWKGTSVTVQVPVGPG